MSTWTSAEGLLQVLNAIGGAFKRLDDGGDLLAFRLSGAMPRRSIYVYIHRSDAKDIKYDLEDEENGKSQWDNAVERGAVSNAEDLFRLCDSWLNGSAALSSCPRQVHPLKSILDSPDETP